MTYFGLFIFSSGYVSQTGISKVILLLYSIVPLLLLHIPGCNVIPQSLCPSNVNSRILILLDSLTEAEQDVISSLLRLVQERPHQFSLAHQFERHRLSQFGPRQPGYQVQEEVQGLEGPKQQRDQRVVDFWVRGHRGGGGGGQKTLTETLWTLCLDERW